MTHRFRRPGSAGKLTVGCWVHQAIFGPVRPLVERAGTSALRLRQPFNAECHFSALGHFETCRGRAPAGDVHLCAVNSGLLAV
jgi:hypothetical protein